MTLLDVAKELPVTTRERMDYTDEHIQLALAWIKGEIGMMQVSRALKLPPNNRGGVYNFLSIAIREAYKKGLLQ